MIKTVIITIKIDNDALIFYMVITYILQYVFNAPYNIRITDNNGVDVADPPDIAEPINENLLHVVFLYIYFSYFIHHYYFLI